MAAHDKFELRCNRRERITAVRLADSDETDKAFNQRKQHYNEMNKENSILNRKSRLVREELNKRRWSLMYSLHLAKRVDQTDIVEILFSDLPDIASLSVRDNESNSSPSPPQPPKNEASIEQHIEVLDLRREDAQIGKEPSWAILNTLALGLTSGIQGYPDDVDIAFRLFNGDSHARFFAGRHDIRCSNWEEFDIGQPLDNKGAERHIESAPIPTNYISISTSPRRIWNLVIKNPARDDQKIAVIDLRVLRRLGIAYGSSTDR